MTSIISLFAMEICFMPEISIKGRWGRKTTKTTTKKEKHWRIKISKCSLCSVKTLNHIFIFFPQCQNSNPQHPSSFWVSWNFYDSCFLVAFMNFPINSRRFLLRKCFKRRHKNIRGTQKKIKLIFFAVVK